MYKGRQFVKQLAHISALALDALQLQLAEEPFCEVVEGHGSHLVHLLVGPRRHLLSCYVEEGTFYVLTADGISGIGDEAQGVDDGVDSQRGVESECLVAHDVEVGARRHEIVCDDGNILVLANQYGDVALPHASPDELVDTVAHELERGVVVVVGGQQCDVDESFGLLAFRYQLLHSAVGGEQLRGLVGNDRSFVVVFDVFGCEEEGVVERYDIASRPIVGVEGQHLHASFCLGKLSLDVVEQLPVAATPSVDALLDVAHDEVADGLRGH